MVDAALVDAVVVAGVVIARLLAPLLIPTLPLPGILLCLVLDANDREVLETFTEADLSGYQSADKALDVFYLTIAMLSVLRNWTHWTAVQVARWLFYYRLVGVTIFEFTDWRPVLLLFPNTFEYFFVFYEVLRSRWVVDRVSGRFFVAAAATIWVVVKLPQEYWIHVLHLDFTDLLKTTVFGVGKDASWGEAIAHRPAALVILALAVAGAVPAARALVRALAPAPDKVRDLKPAPLPGDMDEAHERASWMAALWRVLDSHLVEKIVLVTLISVIFAQALAEVPATPLEITGAVAAVVTFNAFLGARRARAGRSLESAVWSFAGLALLNAAVVASVQLLLGRRAGGLDPGFALFLLLMLTLLVTMYDRFRPVYEVRFSIYTRAP